MEIKIYYSPFNTTFNFILALFLIVIWISLAVFTIYTHKIGVFIFIIAFVIICFHAVMMFIKSFFFLVSKKPALILTKEYFIDNSMNIKIRWADINSVSILNSGRFLFLAFNLADNSIIYRQVSNPIQRLALRANAALFKKSFMTNLGFLKGKTQEIFETVNGYYQNVLKNKNSN